MELVFVGVFSGGRHGGAMSGKMLASYSESGSWHTGASLWGHQAHFCLLSSTELSILPSRSFGNSLHLNNFKAMKVVTTGTMTWSCPLFFGFLCTKGVVVQVRVAWLLIWRQLSLHWFRVVIFLSLASVRYKNKSGGKCSRRDISPGLFTAYPSGRTTYCILVGLLWIKSPRYYSGPCLTRSCLVAGFALYQKVMFSV